MKLIFDFFPIVIFFIAYKIGGIYTATAAFILASCVQMSLYWYLHHRFEKMHVITFILGVLLGGATLFFHDEMFIKWKPTVIYWVFTLVFVASQYIGKKSVLERMMESNITLPKPVWLKLNLSWAIFFAVMGFVNLYVIYNFSTNAWVNFKLFGMLGITFVFVILQGIYMGRHLKSTQALKTEDAAND